MLKSDDYNVVKLPIVVTNYIANFATEVSMTVAKVALVIAMSAANLGTGHGEIRNKQGYYLISQTKVVIFNANGKLISLPFSVQWK